MAAGVEPGIMSFVNHGCNGTYNTATRWDDHEGTIALGQGAPTSVVAYERDTALAYDPWAARHFPAYDLTAGTELLDNYLVFGGIDDLEEWDDNLLVLKTMCTPGGLGSVSLYEAAVGTGGSSIGA
jgi:hypothetical protein